MTRPWRLQVKHATHGWVTVSTYSNRPAALRALDRSRDIPSLGWCIANRETGEWVGLTTAKHDAATCKQCEHEHELLQLLLKKHEHYTAPREQLILPRDPDAQAAVDAYLRAIPNTERGE